MSKHTNSEIAPCPFCGGQAAVITEDRTWIECCDCPSKSECGPFNTEGEAITAWNTRQPPSDDYLRGYDAGLHDLKALTADEDAYHASQPPSDATMPKDDLHLQIAQTLFRTSSGFEIGLKVSEASELATAVLAALTQGKPDAPL